MLSGNKFAGFVLMAIDSYNRLNSLDSDLGASDFVGVELGLNSTIGRTLCISKRDRIFAKCLLMIRGRRNI